jgi:hypothetical protein
MLATLCLAAACLSIMSPPAAAQTASRATGTSAMPRRADGRPDLDGIWDFRTVTPLERPQQLGNKAVLTDQEAAALEKKAAELAAEQDRATPRDVAKAYNSFWTDAGGRAVKSGRTSLIIDPPDGRLPPTVPGAFRQVGSYLEEYTPGEPPVRYRGGGLYPEGPEYRGLAERCLVGFNAGPPILPGGYNQNLQIVQTPNYVMLVNEMVHDARIVPLDGRPHLPDTIRQWMGDPRGRWQGDTLVVESTNFTDKTFSFNDSHTSGMGTGKTLHLTERFRRVDADTLEYEFTVNDPATFTRPFTGLIPMKKSDQLMYEYACHEGNHALGNILAGARKNEKGQPASQTSKSQLPK